jgi:hypothetical protein
LNVAVQFSGCTVPVQTAEVLVLSCVCVVPVM